MRKNISVLLLLVCAIVASGCAEHLTSITQKEDGRYVMTGTRVEFMGHPTGFVWIGEYDAGSNTMKIKQEISQ